MVAVEKPSSVAWSLIVPLRLHQRLGRPGDVRGIDDDDRRRGVAGGAGDGDAGNDARGGNRGGRSARERAAAADHLDQRIAPVARAAVGDRDRSQGAVGADRHRGRGRHRRHRHDRDGRQRRVARAELVEGDAGDHAIDHLARRDRRHGTAAAAAAEHDRRRGDARIAAAAADQVERGDGVAREHGRDGRRQRRQGGRWR